MQERQLVQPTPDADHLDPGRRCGAVETFEVNL
ncbi:hypothetical protein Pmani_038515, partial [Petrolisthes manimaculis]